MIVDRRIPAAVAVLVVLVLGTGAWATESPARVEAGREVFAANCAMCHGGDASGMMGMHPSLRGAVERLTVDGVEVTIRNGRDTQPPMPAFGGRLSDREVDEVIAYLDTLPSGPRNFGPGSDGGGMMGGMQGGATWLIPAVVLLVLLTVAVAAAVAAVRSRRGTTAATAREVLDRRYALGELDREEYLQRRADLEPGM